MGRSFLLRPLEKRVNGENQFSCIDSFSIKHTRWERQISAKWLWKKEAALAFAFFLP
jgi:hypothetical protein